MKKWLKVLMILGAVVTLAACGKSSESSGKKDSDKIVVWAWDESFNIKAVNEAVKAYEKGDNEKLSVEVVTMSQDDIVQKLNTGLASGNTDGLPNIVLVEDYRINGYLTSYPDAFADLSSIVKKDDFSEYKFGVNTIDGKIYGVPFDSGVSGLFYRSDYLKEAGFEKADLENITWDRYIEIGKEVKSKTGHNMLTLDPSVLGIIRIMMQSSGSWYVKEDGKTVDIENNQALKSAINVYKKMLDADIVTQVSGWDSYVNALHTGEVASDPTGSWISGTIMSVADQSGKWAVAPTPRLADVSTSVNASSVGGAGWYVLKDVGNVDKAKDFLQKTFASDPELMNTLAKEIGLVSTLKEARNTSNYQAEVPFYGNQKTFQDFSNWSDKIPSVNYGGYVYAIEGVMTEALQKILSGENTDKVLKDAQKQVETTIVE